MPNFWGLMPNFWGNDAQVLGNDAQILGTDAQLSGTDAQVLGTDAQKSGTDAHELGTTRGLPVRRRDLALPLHHGLARHSLIRGKAAGEARFDGGRRAQAFGSGEDADAAAGADADAAAGVAEGGAGAAGDVEDGLVFPRGSGEPEWGERDEF